MEAFKRSKDGWWWYGGFVTLLDEEYAPVAELAKQYEVPDRIIVGTLARIMLREVLNSGQLPDLHYYIDNYKKSVKEKSERYAVKPVETVHHFQV